MQLHAMGGGVNFINILRTIFLPIFLRQKITKPKTCEKLHKALLYEKRTRKMLMIWTDAFALYANGLMKLTPEALITPYEEGL